MTSTSSGLTMLTSGVSQYLHPDYLQPLPTTLDAKKSPLALLAQTCSAIGKDTSPSKPIIPPLEKSDKTTESDSGSSGPKRPSSHGSKDSNSKDVKPGFRTFPPKEIPPLVPISNQPSPEKTPASSSSSSSSSHPTEHKSRSPATDPMLCNATTSSSSSSSASIPQSSSSSRPVSRGVGSSSSSSNCQRSSSRSSNPGKGEADHHHHHHQQQVHQHHQHHHHHQQQHSNHHSHQPHQRSRDSPSSSSSSSSSSSHHVSKSSSPSHSKPSSSSSQSTPVMQSLSSLSSAMKPSINNPSLLGGINPAHLAGYHHPLSFMGHGLDPSNPAYHSALAAHSSLSSLSAAAAAAQSSALKAAAAGAAPPAALSPYVTYARVRTPSGATTLVPVCRDPYCTNCQLTLQNCHVSATCTAPGCSQCAHEKSLTSLSALGPLGAASSLLLPPLSSSSSLSSNLSALSSLHSLYPPSALAAAAHQGLPYTCNWVAGNDYCGKRFNSSEELLQHLRTHTSSMDSSSLAASYAGLGIPSALAAYQHFPGASAPLSPNSLRRAYPTSLSPVSNLLGASRYHPYKSPLSSVPPSAAAATPQTPQNFPPMGPFFSPYTFFGQRLGAAVVP